MNIMYILYTLSKIYFRGSTVKMFLLQNNLIYTNVIAYRLIKKTTKDYCVNKNKMMNY